MKRTVIFTAEKFMGYKTYTTEAIVCGSKDAFTSDRSYLLFTEHAGMLWATAKSVRVESSKQRFALQEFSIIRVSLVKGKGGWRIGSVEAIANPFLAARDRRARGAVQSIVRNLRRFLHGEEPVPAVFADARSALMLAHESGDTLETLFALRLLHVLGYIKHEAVFADLLEADFMSVAAAEVPPLAHAAIERALKVSHL